MSSYEWFKVLHIIAFTSWMAFLFYMPRLFVYHAEHIDNKGFVEVVKIQESKLFHMIGWIALVVTFASGLWIALTQELYSTGGWLHAKTLVAVLLLAYHFSLYYFMVAFRNDRCKLSGKFFRAYNEVPTIGLILIVIFVIGRPF